MSEIEFVDRMNVEVLYTDFDDTKPVLAARTSTLGASSTPEERRGLIRALIRDGHGVPFEHMHITFRIEAPLFVWPQIQQHRVGTSLSRESGRYRELSPRFYVPPEGRPIVQVGKPMEYRIESGTDEQHGNMAAQMGYTCQVAWDSYQELLSDGIAREVARMALPSNTMTVGVMTFNARSLMHFLQLRTYDAGSHPQYEVAQIAYAMETLALFEAPETFAAFNDNGSKAP
jgi:thymidylate synthase (FAD)